MDFFVLFKQNKLNNLNKQFHSFFSFFGIQDITWHIFEYYLHLKFNWGCIFLSFFEYTWIKSVILVLEFAHTFCIFSVLGSVCCYTCQWNLHLDFVCLSIFYSHIKKIKICKNIFVFKILVWVLCAKHFID